jgi:hypothetical protein
MKFSEAVNKIMPEVQKHMLEKFIIYRDVNGEWNSGLMQEQCDSTSDWAVNAQVQDPFAVTFTGTEILASDFQHISNRVFAKRIRKEYRVSGNSYTYVARARSLACLFEDNADAFSPVIIDYLAAFKKPLQLLSVICPLNFETRYVRHVSKGVSVRNTLAYIKRRVTRHLLSNYRHKQSVHAAKNSIVLAENLNSSPSYIVYEYNRSGNARNYSIFSDYDSAMNEFLRRRMSFVSAPGKKHVLPEKTMEMIPCFAV